MVPLIERDLIRWGRRRWTLVILAVFLAHIALLAPASRTPVHRRSIYPKEPAVAFFNGGRGDSRKDWLELEDPMLFARAHSNGFSAFTWLRKKDWPAPPPGDLAPPRFLEFARASIAPLAARHALEFASGRHERPAPMPGTPEVPPRGEPPRSTLVVELPGRPVLKIPELPVQYHSDVVTNSIVHVMVGPDGFVISPRLIQGSGLKRADLDALSLSRQVRFAPGDRLAIAVGKLIFQWHALDLSSTNNAQP